MLIGEKRLEQALRFLAETDENAAALRADVERAEFKAKAVKDTLFLHAEGTVADRSAKAGAHETYAQAMSAYFEAVRASDAIRNKRATEVIVVDTWRSLNSGRNKGNIT